MSGITILLVDDEALLRQSLAIILSAALDIDTVHSLASGDEALAFTTPVDIIVMDYDMPGKDGLTTAQELNQQPGTPPILMLTRHARPGLLRQALGAGVRGFLTKAAAPDHVLSAIRTLLATGRYLDPDIAISAVANDCPLTDRELDVLRLAGRGHTAPSIARQLHLAPGTVRNYISSAMFKTHTTRKEDAIEHARHQHWI